MTHSPRTLREGIVDGVLNPTGCSKVNNSLESILFGEANFE